MAAPSLIWNPAAVHPDNYDGVREDSLAERRGGALAGLRQGNNFVKEALMSRAYSLLAQPPSGALRVVDLCCGRGGDLPKYIRLAKRQGLSLSYRGADRLCKLIQFARSRGAVCARPCDEVNWDVADCFAPGVLAGHDPAELVSCHMALHYAADTRERMDQALANLAERCAPGGVVAVSTTDSGPLLSYALETKGAKHAHATVVVQPDLPADSVFGAKIWFKLEDSQTGGVRVDDYEWLVHRDTVCAMAAAHGLRCVRWVNFQEEFTAAMASKLWRAEWLGRRITLNSHDWEIMGVYCAALFIKQAAA